jgi:molybdopterin-guanine dinucleotide biosynthesis protein A
MINDSSAPPSHPEGTVDRARRPAVAAIVLAGGRGARFGGDKLVALLEGRPLLHHALIAVSPVVAELVVVIRPHGAPPRLPDPALLTVPVQLVRDPEPYGGPLVALAAALERIEQPAVLVVAGDMPTLQPGVLVAMLHALDERNADVVILAGPGPVQSLPAAIRSAPALPAAREALGASGRSLRALYDRLTVAVLAEAEWRALDPTGATLRDVDTTRDLVEPVGQAPGHETDPVRGRGP